MRHFPIIMLCLLLSLSISIKAQEANVSSPDKVNIVERIQSESNGNVVIDIPADVLKDILEEPAQRTVSPQPQRKGGSARHERVSNQGYRIQIFGDGRNQATLRSRATARANAVCARFPKYRGQVYSFSKSPNWYTRVGNFKSRQEAEAALRQLKRAFPAFSSEMRIVKSTIVPIR